ncbi:hypothetical protein RUE5091_04050 [Ruegeria denitrificans]|uniref:Uncharacterized protein n=1 Tax=Ruegeria denitrificans TaxID=1715692 RepID=A0A0P1J024_9RHOB|nr:hypothetical protein RUE5091_04050 [Ruegeria denitrificans]
MWSFLALFVLILGGMLLLLHPAVANAIHSFMLLATFFMVVLLLTLIAWLALSG